MSNELFYIDESGKKRDKELHDELLGDDDGPRIRNLEEIAEPDQLRWDWAYREQITLLDKHDAVLIETARNGWKNREARKNFNRFLQAYGLRRGPVGGYLSDEGGFENFIDVCHPIFSQSLPETNFRKEAQERWNAAVDRLYSSIQKCPRSATLKTFWFYHPSKLPMYDAYAFKTLQSEAKRLGWVKYKSEITPEKNFLEYFYRYYDEQGCEEAIDQARSRHYRDSKFNYRIADQYLWLIGSGKADSLLEDVRLGLKYAPIKHDR